MRRFFAAVTAIWCLGLALAVVPVGVAQAGPMVPASPAASKPEPYTSPSVTRHLQPFAAPTCASGHLCAYTVASNVAGSNVYYYFDFYKCYTYNVLYWHSYNTNAQVLDHQTGNVTTTFYGASGNVLQTVKPKSNLQDILLLKGGWDSVYSIRVC